MVVWKKLVIENQVHTKPFDFVEKSDDYNMTVDDLGKCIILTGSVDKVFTLPDCDSEYAGSRIRCSVSGTAALTVKPYLGTINGLTNLVSKHQHAWVELILLDTNTWMVYSNSKKYSEYYLGSWHLLPEAVSGYSYIKEIRILEEKVSGTEDIIDFPLTFDSTDDDFRTVLNGGCITNSNGYDIIFTDSDGVTQLDHEIEKYDGVNGIFIAHVRIPTLYHDANTIIYIHYSNDDISVSQENVNGVWDSNYIAVYHLNDDFNDSTIFTNDGVDVGTSDTAAKISNGRSFSDDYIQLDSVIEDIDESQGTISAWITLDNVGSDQQLWQFYADANNYIYAKYLNDTNILQIGRSVGSVGSSDWMQVASQLESQNQIFDMTVYNDKIYGVTEKSVTGGLLFEWNGADAWTKVASQLLGQISIQTVIVYNNKIYAGTVGNGYLFEWNGTNAWVKVADQCGTQNGILALCVYNNKLYGGTTPNGCLLEWNDVDAWVQVAGQLNGQSYIFTLIEVNNKIYAGTATGGRLFRWNDVDAWEEMAAQSMLQTYTRGLVTLNGKIYAGTSNNGYLFEWSGLSEIVDKYVEVDDIIEGSSTFNKITMTWDETEDELIVYVNGEQKGSIQTSISEFVGSLNSSTNLGATYNELLPWNGDIDEFRISTVARSSDWESTEFNNQNSPSEFYTMLD